MGDLNIKGYYWKMKICIIEIVLQINAIKLGKARVKRDKLVFVADQDDQKLLENAPQETLQYQRSDQLMLKANTWQADNTLNFLYSFEVFALNVYSIDS